MFRGHWSWGPPVSGQQGVCDFSGLRDPGGDDAQTSVQSSTHAVGERDVRAAARCRCLPGFWLRDRGASKGRAVISRSADLVMLGAIPVSILGARAEAPVPAGSSRTEGAQNIIGRVTGCMRGASSPSRGLDPLPGPGSFGSIRTDAKYCRRRHSTSEPAAALRRGIRLASSAGILY
jgi:hypothetical protein